MTSTTRGWGRTGPSLWAAAAAQMAPMMNCPSPPMFQKRILKAGASAMPTQSSVDRSRSIQLKRVMLAKVPLHMTP